MKILYLKLENFAGVYAGLKKDEIEIDFVKDIEGSDIPDDREIVMLFGGNGSGKSTILSTLHPFLYTNNDNRGNPIIPDREGYKEIHYRNGDDFYIIRHHYKSSSNKSYIYKTDNEGYLSYRDDGELVGGEELNEPGGIRAFKEIVEIELDVNEDFFKLSRLGSNVTNFIDLPTAKRKEYIGQFLPDIQSYLEAYNTVNDKYRVLKKDLSYISDEMLKLDSRETLENSLDIHIKQVEESNNKLNEILQSKTKLETLINNLTNDEDVSDNPFLIEYNRRSQEILQLGNNLKERQTLLKESEYPLNSEELDKLITEKNHKAETTKMQLDQYRQSINDMFEDIHTMEKSLDDNKDDTKALNSNLKSTKQEMEDIETLLTVYKNDLLEDYSKITLDDAYKISRIADSFRDYYIDIYKEIGSEGIQNFITFVNNPNMLNEIEDNISNYEDSITKDRYTLSNLEANLHQLDILKSRPNECTIDSCPFIANALQYSNIENDIKSVKLNINKVQEILDGLYNKRDGFKTIIPLVQEGQRLYESHIDFIKTNTNIYSEINSLDDFYQYVTSTTKDNLLKDINLDLVPKYKQQLDLHSQVSARLEHLLELDKQAKKSKSMRAETQERYDKAIEKRNGLYEKANELEKVLVEFSNELKSINEHKERVDSHNVDVEAFKNSKEEVLELYEKSNKREEIQKKVHEYQTKINSLIELQSKTQLELNRHQESVDQVKYKIARLDDYEAREKKVREDFDIHEVIKESLDPKKGIPIHFMDGYLETTRDTANELLDLAHKGNFAIDFEVTSKDFFIKVYKGEGGILEDINLASQGETAITSLSLSLALIEQSMSRHNILYLDEVDGALDDRNRRSFIDMVHRQMDNLDIEQVFIISHNREFDPYPMNLILLPGHSVDVDNPVLMDNKSILYR